MTSLFPYLASIALVLPLLDGPSVTTEAEFPGTEDIVWNRDRANDARDANDISLSERAAAWTGFSMSLEPPPARQIRIEQRVIMRVVPQPDPSRRNLMPEIRNRGATPRLVERKMGTCVGVSGIVGVQPERNDRLILFMRDRRIISAELEKTCSARDFYAGFYVERNDDGQLCVARDRLQSRSGASCQVSRMRQLVADRED